MLRVKKGNQEFRVPDTSLESYLAQGFDLIDDKGEVIKLGSKENSVADIARENKELRRRNRVQEEGIKQRDETIAALRAELAAALAAAKEGGGAADETADEEDSDEEPSDPADEEPSDPEGAAEQFVCGVCGKVCSTAGGLTKHMKTHA